MLAKQHKKRKKKNLIIYYLLIGSAVTMIPLVYRMLSASSKKKKNTQALLSGQKTSEAFDGIMYLAKNNSPEFWGHFQEKYPDFQKKLLEINSNLKVSELILSAYIYLGFNTKDIAEYTFKAVQTVKNNKYNLRKRLSVPAKDDMVVWFRNNLGN
jgi:DNA-binding NarL/FixJ family response regulator